MNYELAKKLKDAGFPQGISEEFFGRYALGGGEPVLERRNDPSQSADELADSPTLPELLEACGRFQHRQIGLIKNGDEWMAGLDSKSSGVLLFESTADFESDWCKTPEEAVANLWLALQKSGCC